MSRSSAALSGVLATVGPMTVAFASWVHGEEALARLSLVSLAAALGALFLTGGGLLLGSGRRAGMVLASGGLLALLLVTAEKLVASPALALVALIVFSAVVGLSINSAKDGENMTPADDASTRARFACIAAALLWLAGALAGRPGGTIGLFAEFVSFLVALVFALWWFSRYGYRRRWRAVAAVGAAAVAIFTGYLIRSHWERWIDLGFFLAVVVAATLPAAEREKARRLEWWQVFFGHPARLLLSTFLALCALGAVLLALPECSAGSPVRFIDAAFTAVSAVCVTGLTVLDTPRDFSLTGQVAILVLIQLGGLGIMTFSTAAMRLLRRRMSLRQEGAMASLLSAEDRGRLYGAARRLIVFTFYCELAGALLLFFLFLGCGDAVAQALWRAVFTAVSAFCNAGFALQSDSLVVYQHSPAVLHVVAALIVIGGLSPAAALAVPGLLGGRPLRLSAQARLVLFTTAFLLCFGAVFVAATEWNSTLRGLSFWDRVHNAWFQSVTLRTAGFNSVDMAALHPATLSLMTVWMFIGGSPGGTAGGIKTTTAVLLVLALVAAVCGRWQVTAFGRRIPHRSVYKAIAIVVVAAGAVFFAFLALQLTQSMPTETAFFEAVSAFGTVGLSLGGTAALDGIGKIIVMLCMFTGRVGPLTLFMFLSTRSVQDPWQRPEEEIEVG
jgi:trk system potassium uptake protein TrkH